MEWSSLRNISHLSQSLKDPQQWWWKHPRVKILKSQIILQISNFLNLFLRSIDIYKSTLITWNWEPNWFVFAALTINQIILFHLNILKILVRTIPSSLIKGSMRQFQTIQKSSPSIEIRNQTSKATCLLTFIQLIR